MLGQRARKYKRGRERISCHTHFFLYWLCCRLLSLLSYPLPNDVPPLHPLVKHYLLPALLVFLSLAFVLCTFSSVLPVTAPSFVFNARAVWTWSPCVYVHMACHGSYTVVIIPLQNSLYSTDALRFFHWLKKLQDLEREKDSLWIGLQFLEQARLCYRHQLHRVSQTHAGIDTIEHDKEKKSSSCALRSCMQRVNGSLGSLLNNAYVCSAAHDEKDDSDWYLRWTNATLTQELGQKNNRISVLEFEKQMLIQQQNGIH